MSTNPKGYKRSGQTWFYLVLVWKQSN